MKNVYFFFNLLYFVEHFTKKNHYFNKEPVLTDHLKEDKLL